MNYAKFLIREAIKSAALWSPKRPMLASRLARQKAKHVLKTKPGEEAIVPGVAQLGGGATSPGAFDVRTKKIVMDPKADPGMQSLVLPHEIDEAKYFLAAQGQPSPIINVPPRGIPFMEAVSRMPQRMAEIPGVMKYRIRAGQQAQSTGAHFDPRVLLDESHRIATGQVEPAAADYMRIARRRTGERDALRRAGIEFGKTVAQPGGRAYNRALQKFRDLYGLRLGWSVPGPNKPTPLMYNIGGVTEKLNARRKAERLANQRTTEEFLSVEDLPPELRAQIKASE
jgi:hypothetical protein